MRASRLFIVVFVALAAACSSGSSHNSSTATTAPSPGGGTATTMSPAAIAASKQTMKDVKLKSCAGDAAHHTVVKGTVHNSAAKAANYAIAVTITDAGGRHNYATVASVDRVAPGETANWQAATTAPYENGSHCSVTGATATAP
jgi:hypothetical protein